VGGWEGGEEHDLSVLWQGSVAFFSNPVKNLRFRNRQEISLLVEQP